MAETPTKEEIIRLLKSDLSLIHDRYGVEKIAVYGSYAKGLASEGSDIDLLVQLNRPLGFEFIQLADYLEEKLGLKVDLATFDNLERSKANPRKTRLASDIEGSLIYV